MLAPSSDQYSGNDWDGQLDGLVEPLDPKMRGRLRAAGIPDRDLDSPWPIGSTRGVFAPEHRFNITAVGDTNAVGIEVRDRRGVVDIAIWCPRTNRIATLLGVAAGLNEGVLCILPPHYPIPIWRTPWRWLKARRIGSVVLDHVRFRSLAGARPLIAEDERHAEELRRALAFFPVVIAPLLGPSANDLEDLHHHRVSRPVISR